MSSSPHTDRRDLAWLGDVTMADLETDPYPVFARLRRESPVAYVPILGVHVVASQEIARHILSSPDFGATTTASGARTLGSPTILGANGELHRELRSIFEPPLRASEAPRWAEEIIRPAARACVESFEQSGSAELVAQFCEPVSVRALGDLLGLHDVPTERLRTWFHMLASSFANTAVDADGNFIDPAGFAAGDQAKAEIRAVLEPRLAELSVRPDGSVLSHWLHDGMPPGETRAMDKILTSVHGFLLGGQQEPGHAMASTLAGLLQNPAQLERVIDDPALISRAVEEGVRWISPIWSATARVALRDVILAGTELPAGTVVMMAYGGTNRDEQRWDDPDRYNLDRPSRPHLAFGAGAHACMGIHFANTVCRIALEELFDTIPNLAADPDYDIGYWGFSFRGPTALHVRWEV